VPHFVVGIDGRELARKALALRDGADIPRLPLPGGDSAAELATRAADVDLEAAFLAHWASFRGSLSR